MWSALRFIQNSHSVIIIKIVYRSHHYYSRIIAGVQLNPLNNWRANYCVRWKLIENRKNPCLLITIPINVFFFLID